MKGYDLKTAAAEVLGKVATPVLSDLEKAVAVMLAMGWEEQENRPFTPEQVARIKRQAAAFKAAFQACEMEPHGENEKGE